MFLDPFGLLITAPLYALHILVLAGIIVRRGKRISFNSLFFAGILFGLYEAYVTKVLWNPPSGKDPLTIGGIAVVATLVIVLFWHPMMPFILPFSLVDTFMLKPSFDIVTQDKIKKIISKPFLPYLYVILLGVINGTTIVIRGKALLSTIPACKLFFLLFLFWKRRGLYGKYELDDLLPRGIFLAFFITLLVSMYMVLGFILRPEALPGFKSQFIIWLFYLIILLLLWCSFRRGLDRLDERGLPEVNSQKNPVTHENASELHHELIKMWVLMSIIFIASSFIANIFLVGTNNFFMLLLWVIAIPGGIYLLTNSFVQCFKT